jgi:DNA-binding HxlR family transcriptional regulator
MELMSSVIESEVVTLPRTYTHENCPVAGTLEVVGERWTLLILRDAFLGVRRFADFQARLDVSRNVLTRRLGDLVDAGLLRREPYQQRPARYEYLPTEKALELWPALVGLGQWGGAHAAPDGRPREVAHAACGTTLEAQVRCPRCDQVVAPADALSRPGPGFRRGRGELASLFGEPRPLLESVR